MTIAGVLIFAALASTAHAFDSQGLADCLVERSQSLNQEAVLQSKANLADTKAGYLPTASLSDQLTRERTTDASDSFNAVSVTIQQKFFDASLSAAIDAGEAAVKAEYSDLRQKNLTDAFEAVQALVQIQTLESQSELLKNQTASYQALARVLSVGNRIGLSDSNDLLQLRASVLANDLQMKKVDFALQNVVATFRAKFGFDPPPLSDLTLKTDSAVVIEKLPNIRALKARVDQISFQKKQADLEAWPQLSLQLSYTSSSYQNGLPSNAYSQGYIGVVMNLSGLWTARGRFVAYDGIANQRRMQVKQQVEESLNAYDQVDRELRFLSEQKPLLKERYDLAIRSREVSDAKLRIGRIGFLELQQVEQSVYSAAQDKLFSAMREQQLRLQKEMTIIFSSDHSRRDTSCTLRK